MSMSRFYLFGKLVIAGMVLLMFTSCGNGRYSGELIGTRYTRGWQDSKPLGMSYVRGGSFVMGANADELDLASFERGRAVQVLPFWMDETEITNSEYKQFVNWVLENIARSRLADPEIGARDEFYVGSKRGQFDEDDDEMPKELDWKRKIPWENKDGDEDVALALNDLYYKGGDIINDAKELNASKFIYKYRCLESVHPDTSSPWLH